jgi:chromate transporter
MVPPTPAPAATENAARLTLRQTLPAWLKIAALSFGGPAGQIAVMHRVVVDERRWVSEPRFLHALNFCMLLPGPEAQQLATYLGWAMHGVRGGLVAGGLFILPGVVAILALSYVYVLVGQIGPVAALFLGLKAAVIAIVIQALIRIGRRALRNHLAIAIAAASFAAIFIFGVPFPLIILGAALLGFVGSRAGWALAAGGHGPAANGAELLDEPAPARATRRSLLLIAVVGLVLWWAPVLAAAAVLGGQHVFVEIGLFFSQMALVTFGGAYAVLSYVAQYAVETAAWLTPGEMLDGLGLAETTPGPLIMVLQFVGFLAAHGVPGELSPLAAGTVGGLLATWVTFVPSFLLVLLGAPFVEALRGQKALSAALGAITAAVVGVILNLALWFALHVLFADVEVVTAGGWLALSVPVLASIDWAALGLMLLASMLIFGLRVGMLLTIAATSLAGLGLFLIGVG